MDYWGRTAGGGWLRRVGVIVTVAAVPTHPLMNRIQIMESVKTLSEDADRDSPLSH